MIIYSKDKDYLTKWFYDKMRLENSHLNFKGIYRKNFHNVYVIEALSSSTLASDGNTLLYWFDRNKPMTSNIALVSLIPEGYVEVESRNKFEIVHNSYGFRTLRMFKTDLILYLHKSFPDFEVINDDIPGLLTIKVSRNLSDSELNKLKEAINLIGPDANVQLAVEEHFQFSDTFRSPNIKADLDLMPSRYFKRVVTPSLMDILHRDEDFWSDNKEKFLFSDKIDKFSLLKDLGFENEKSRCIIDCQIEEPHDIRNYLSIYEKLSILVPTYLRYEQILKCFNITEDELVWLATQGRAEFLFINSIDRYPLTLLEKLSDLAPNSVILSRTMAGLSILESRRRMPFLYPCFGIQESQILLRHLVLFTEAISDKKIKTLMQVFIKEITKVYVNLNDFVQYRGFLAVGFNGLSGVISSIIKNFAQVDRFLEFSSASFAVESAAALGGNVFPGRSDSIIADGLYTQMYADLYNDIPIRNSISYSNKTIHILKNIFTISNTIEIKDFVSNFQGSDINRLRKVIRDIITHHKTDEKINETISDFNKSIVNYENKKERLASVDIRGLVNYSNPLIVALLSLKDPNLMLAMAATPLAVYIYERLIYFREKNEIIGSILDSLDGLLTGQNKDFVLVARLKKNFKT
ncbi:hypothetical protein LEP1GSC040_1744 [Leptospira santarosai str. 2000030832]|nr:hypothetical protein LEP1GSC040_1744 [Leptospira santarosai str. 2000030832]